MTDGDGTVGTTIPTEQSQPRPLPSDRIIKVTGLSMFAVGVAALLVTGEYVDDHRQQTATFAGLWRYGWPWLIAAHLASAGLIVLVAGLNGVPLSSSARARRGAVVKLTGASLLIFCLVYANIESMTAFTLIARYWWIELPTLVLFVMAARGGIALMRRGWKYDALTAEDLLARDRRPPIVYLRSFQIDDQVTLSLGGFWDRIWRFINYTAAISPEQELAAAFERVGPVVAIGKPGEPLPELGAARLYVDDERWRQTIADLIRQARLVIIRAGPTPNLWWEVQQTMQLVARQRVLIVSLGAASETASFDARFEQTFGHPAPGAGAVGPSVPRWLAPMVNAHAIRGRMIYFDDHGQPREEPMRLVLSWFGLLTGIVRPYGDAIQSAVRRVLADLGLTATRSRSQTIAVLLGLLGGGLFGLHAFYVGDKRRALRLLALFWIGLPLVVGIYDAVQMALLDRGTFAKRYPAV